MKRHALTLLETAAMTAAVSALLLLLIPALANIRNDGRNKKCLNNLGRIATASAAYASSDPQERLTPAHPLMGHLPGALGEVEWGGRSGRGEVIVGQASDFTNSKWGTRFVRGPSTRKLNEFIYGRSFPNFVANPGADDVNWVNDANLNLDIFKCPADIGYTGLHYASFRNFGLSSFDHYGNSYAASTLWTGFAGGNCRLLSNSAFLRSASNVPAPTQTILYMENNGRFAWRKNFGTQDGCQFLSGDTPVESNMDTIGWHNRPWLFNAAFVDGHVATIEMRGHYNPQPNIGIYPDIGGQTGSYENYRCITVRGPGWQMDTLPAPLIQTTIECNTGGVVLIVED